MSQNDWKPVYDYKMSLTQRFWMFLGKVLILVCFIIIFVLYVFPEVSGSNIIALFLVGSIVVFLIIFTSVNMYQTSSSVKKTKSYLRQNNIEFINTDFLDRLFLVKSSKNLLGLFDINEKKFLFQAEYQIIKKVDDFFFLKNKEGLWGVYNIKIGKNILDYKYNGVKSNPQGNIEAIKDDVIFEFSPYGTLIKQKQERKLNPEEVQELVKKFIHEVY